MIETYIRNQEHTTSISLTELVESVKLLQEQVNDLRWRMNEVCMFLSIKETNND